MSDDSKELSRVEDILSGEDYLPKKPMSRVEELLMDGAMVPKVDSTDNGKVLKVIDGEWKPGEDISGDKLPQVDSSDNGKILKVIEGEWNMGDDNDRLPIPGSGDNGKILRIVNGDWQKVTLAKDVQYVQLETSYPFSGNSVNLPEDINDILIANYVGEDILPTYLITSNGVIFTPDTIEVGGTPSNRIVYIYWIRLIHKFNSALQQDDIYEETLYYLTSKYTKTAAYSSQKAIESLPSVDSTDANKVLQVSNAGKWVSNLLPEVAGVPIVEQADVGKVLKATAVGEYDWGDAPDPLPAVTSVDNGKVLKVVEGAWAAGADEGGSEAVYKTLAEYQALPTADKEDPTKIYFVIDEGTKVSPTLNADDGNVEASSYFNNSQDQRGFPWHAFDGVDGSGANKTVAWNPWNSGETWISYSFDTMYSFSKVRIYAEAWTNPLDLDYYIEGSNDGTTWTNIALKGGHVDVNFVPSTGVNNFQQIETVILLDGTKRYSKIRLRIDGPNINYGNACLFMVYDFSIYASNTVSTPLIYYKNILYNPNVKELPNTVVADAGKALVVNSDGVWDKSLAPSVTPIRISKANYDALTPAQKADTSKMYLIDGSIITDETLISPDDLAADDGNVISSGANSSNNPGWKLFSGSKSTSPFSNTFMPAYNTQTCYAGYHFTDKPHRITKVKYRVIWSGNFGTVTNSVYVEGSNDGTNWIDIGGGAVAMSIEENSYSDYEVPCDMNEYSYVRIRFANPVNVTGSNKFFTMSYLEIYATETDRVYNAICYNGDEFASLDPQHYFKEISQTDYDNLPDTKNSDGIIYFITDNS